MQILSKNFLIPQNISENKAGKQFNTVPNFGSAKTKIIESLSKEISNGININTANIKEILADPQKRTLFFEMLGATIVSTVTNLVNLLSSDDNKAENKISTQTHSTRRICQNSDPTTPKMQKLEPIQNESNIKFDTINGPIPKIEKDFKIFVEENFAEDKNLSDKLKLLYNKFAAKNRKGSHILDNKIIPNKELLVIILNELEKNVENTEEINNVINKYQGLFIMKSSEIGVKDIKPKAKFKIKLSKNIDDVLSRNAKLKLKYEEIIQNSESKEIAIKKLSLIDKLLKPKSEFIDDIAEKRAIKALSSNYIDYLEKIAFIVESIPETEKADFYIALANRELAPLALETWDKDVQNKGCTFSLYNEFKKVNLNNEQIKNLTALFSQGKFNELKINAENKNFTLSLPYNISLNRNFTTITKVFEEIFGKKIDLKAEPEEKINKEQLIEILKNDFYSHKSLTYKNIKRYLYGDRHQIRTEKDFNKNQLDYRFDKLLDVFNDEKLFNAHFFSNHCKLRFIERFVLNEDFGEKTLGHATREKVKYFINETKKALINGIAINPYSSEGNYIGAQLTIPSREYGDIKITLDDHYKIHTVF